MPPVYSGLKLSDAEIETLRLWIAQGAKWQKHWSFIPPRAARRCRRSRTPTGRAIRSTISCWRGWTARGSTPSPEASRETLLRRVTLDLTGLPPTPAEIDASRRQIAPDAYEKVVDRLLASPRYGERMAERWLDAARYADSNGYQYDGERIMWRWRDWVIDAFNRNQPFDQFTLEQIAGDMLPNATLEQKIATGFNRNHRGNTEDGIVPEEYAVEYVVDRVETTSTVFLGLTLGCARCHNHKYDPFTQKEFYQFFAYFNNVPENWAAPSSTATRRPLVPAPTREQQAKLGADRSPHRRRSEDLSPAARRSSAPRRAPGRRPAAPNPDWWSPAADLKLAAVDRPKPTATFPKRPAEWARPRASTASYLDAGDVGPLRYRRPLHAFRLDLCGLRRLDGSLVSTHGRRVPRAKATACI